MTATKSTYIYAFKLRLEGGGVVTGRVEAHDHREATHRATEQWASRVVVSGNINLLKNQEKARKERFIALN